LADEQISLDGILGEVRDLVQRHAVMLAFTGLAIAAAYSVLDLLGAAGAATGFGLVVNLLVQYQVLERLLADRMLPEAKEKRRYGSLLGAGLLSGIGIGIGFLLLVIPGIYLSGRWLSASAYVVAEGKWANDSLTASWDASEHSAVPHAFAALISGIPLMAFIVAVYGGQGVESLTATVFLNALTAISSLLAWVFSAAAYRVQRPGHGELDTVFA
jgi:hypothetical protein